MTCLSKKQTGMKFVEWPASAASSGQKEHKNPALKGICRLAILIILAMNTDVAALPTRSAAISGMMGILALTPDMAEAQISGRHWNTNVTDVFPVQTASTQQELQGRIYTPSDKNEPKDFQCQNLTINWQRKPEYEDCIEPIIDYYIAVCGCKINYWLTEFMVN